MDRTAIFAGVRRRVFAPLLQSQVDGISQILDAWALTGGGADRQLAYVLATAQHETANTMQPLAERGGDAYKTRLSDVRGENPARARYNGNDRPGDGVRYAGRGYVQLTWKNNYRRVGERLGIDLVAQPDLALRPDIAARILVRGMRDGWFTGRRLDQYIGADRADFTAARRIVNGTDRAAHIAGLADAWWAAIAPGR